MDSRSLSRLTMLPPQPPPHRPPQHRPVEDGTLAPGGRATTEGRPATTTAHMFTEPPRRRDRLGAWLLLAVCVAVASPAMLLELHRPDAVDPEEVRTLAASTQCWRRLANMPDRAEPSINDLVSRLHGQPNLQQPPGLTWLHLAAYAATPARQSMTADTMIIGARITSVMIALVTIGAVYWAGTSIGGMAAGLFAALVCGANPLFVYHARLASGAIHHAGWVLLATAAALWAIRPLRPSSSLIQQAAGWATCGLAMGVATLTVGPEALIEVCVPALLIMALSPRRINHGMGLLAALLIGLLMAMPWAGHVQSQDPGVWGRWWRDLFPVAAAGRDNPGGPLGGWPVVIAMAALGPWLIWLIGAAVQPLSVSSVGSRGRMMLGWVWFGCMLMTRLFVFDHRRTGDWLVVVPSFSVLIGTLFSQYHTLAAQGRFVRSWRLLRWPHVLALLALSILIPVALCIQETLVERGLIARPLSEDPGWMLSLGIGLLLLMTTALSARWAIRQHPGHALVCWAVWMLLLMWALLVPTARGPAARNPIRHEAAQVAQRTAGQALFWALPMAAKWSQPHPALLLYLGRPIESIPMHQLNQTGRQDAWFYLLAQPGALATNPRCRVEAHLPHAGLDLVRVSSGPLDQPMPQAASSTVTAP